MKVVMKWSAVQVVALFVFWYGWRLLDAGHAAGLVP